MTTLLRVNTRPPLATRDRTGQGQGLGRGEESYFRKSLASTGYHHNNGGIQQLGGETEEAYDFWGPCGVVTGYCVMLWLAGQEDVSYVYLVWVLSSAFHHFTVRPFLEESSILFHMSVLG